MKNSKLKQQTTQADNILGFYKSLKPGFVPGDGIEIMNPFLDPTAWSLTEAFYRKFYSDPLPRVMVFGINPGRFGGGITGVPFTDPIRLEADCGIKNDLRKVPELSSVFVYEVVKAYGGAEKFYGRFFITALSPLGFVKNGLNMNYYDDKVLSKDSEPFIIECIREQINRIPTIDTCFCLGEGTNFKIFNKLNEKHQFFKSIIPLPHPRWVMQYRRKRVDEFAEKYVGAMSGL